MGPHGALHPGHPNFQTILAQNRLAAQQNFRNGTQTNQPTAAVVAGRPQIPPHLSHPHPNNNPHPAAGRHPQITHLQQHQQNQQRLRSRSNSSGPAMIANPNQQPNHQFPHIQPQNNNNKQSPNSQLPPPPQNLHLAIQQQQQ